ncbi:MAG: hypothetical protein ACLQUY_04970 [Ktedonobacterales bacterium]
MTDHALPPYPTPLPLSTSWRRVAPIATLIFLSPVLTELLMGIVHITNLWLLVPEMAVYGVAALLIREAVRRQHRGWGMILLLGMAYALAEECVILQTSLTPQFFTAGTSSFGWAFGVQWIYLVAMLGYESVYAIVLPIALTELLFPDQRAVPWLSRRGIGIAIVVFILSSVGVWWLWSHVGLQRYGSSTYHIPPLNVGLALLVIGVVVSATLGLRLPTRSVQQAIRRAWSPWLLGSIAFTFALIWWILVVFAYLPASSLPAFSPLIPIGIGLAWAGLALLVVRYLSTARGWQDRHQLALIFGAVLASMVGGVLVILADSPLDILGKLVFDLIAIVLLACLAWSLRKQRPAAVAESDLNRASGKLSSNRSK